MRLDKFLVDCGVGRRSQVKTFLKRIKTRLLFKVKH